MSHRPRSSLLRSLPLALLLAPSLGAQAAAPACNREATTSIRFGLAGGNLMPGSVELTARGLVRRRSVESAGPVLGRIPRDSVRALARRAWRGGFASLPPAPTRPTANPDAARRFIELHSACGSHHVEYAPGTESRLFRELYGRLSRLVEPITRENP